jgi:hypothetical protein
MFGSLFLNRSISTKIFYTILFFIQFFIQFYQFLDLFRRLD